MNNSLPNSIEVTIPDDLYKIASDCRESVYYLKSLESYFKSQIETNKNFEEKKSKELLKKFSQYQKEFNEIENKAFFPQKNKASEGIVVIDFYDLIGYSKNYILLKEKIDTLQLDTLKYVYNIGYESIGVSIRGKQYLKPLQSHYQSKLQVFSAFSHSKNEEAFTNYRISFQDKSAIKEYKKNNNYPIAIKVKNQDFLLKKWRELLKLLMQSQQDLIIDAIKTKQSQSLRKGAKEEIIVNKEPDEEQDLSQLIITAQYQINKKLNKLNTIVLIIVIIGIIYGTISTAFLIRDYFNESKKAPTVLFEKSIKINKDK